MPGEQQDNSDNLVPPDLRGRYSDFVFLGAGGMGRVIGAHDNHLNKSVAIKLLPRNSENAIAVMRFQQEAKAVSKLNNPHIVQVLDFGYSESGEPYLVMEHVKGHGLETLFENQGSLTILESINIGVQLCSALEHAHANDVVHRDLKPSNIFLDTANSVKVLDFGLARILSIDETDWRLTRPGQPVGSILYMSPEQVRGEEADERSDIYSLALVILKMVSGKLPFEGKNALKIVSERLEDKPPAIPEGDDDNVLRDVLNEVLQKALSIQLEDRFQNMTEFKTALSYVSERANEIASELAVSSTADADSERLLKWIKVIVAVALIGVAVFAAASYVKTLNDKLIEQNFRDKRNAMIEQKFFVEPPDTLVTKLPVSDQDLEMLRGLQFTGIRFKNDYGENITSKGVEALTLLPKLQKLVLVNVKVGDSCISSINKMHKLTWLDVQNTHVTDKGILNLSPSLNLLHIDIKLQDEVTCDGLRYIIKTYPDLVTLSVSSTGITNDCFKQIGRLASLRHLHAAAIGLTDEGLSSISNLKLISLDLSNNLITDKSFQTLEKMTTINSLELDLCTKITKPALDKFRNGFRGEKLTPVHSEEVESVKDFFSQNP